MPPKYAPFLFLTLTLASCIYAQENPASKNTASNTFEPSSYVSLDELKNLGHTITAIASTKVASNAVTIDTPQNQFLICSKQDPKHCICLEPLPCEQNNTCIKFADNIQALENALKNTGKMRGENKVSCQYADIGTCGEFNYLNFAGDIHRRELRWFNAAGTLVGQRNATDYPAYCNGVSQVLYQGKIPKCPTSKQERSICGEPWAHDLNPLQTLGLEIIPAK